MKIPLVALCLFVVFALLYFESASPLIPTRVYDEDGLLFQTDTFEVANDMTSYQAIGHWETTVHPLYVLFVNPLGVWLRAFMSAPAAVVLVLSFFGGLNVSLAFLVFACLGLDWRRAFLFAAFYGLAACNLILGSVPERHIMAASSMALALYGLVRRPGNLGFGAAAGLAAIGMTLTNVVQTGLLYLFALFFPARPPRITIGKIFLRFFGFAALTLAGATGLSLLQKWIWPDTRIFWDLLGPGFEEESGFLFSGDLHGLAARSAELAKHMFLFAFIAPVMAIRLNVDHFTLTFDGVSPLSFSMPGLCAVFFWVVLLVLAMFRKWEVSGAWKWLVLGGIGCLVFHFGLHTMYGDDFLLYGVNWALLLLVMVAIRLYGGKPSPARVLMADVALMGLLVTGGFNNIQFMRTLSAYFLGGAPDLWEKDLPAQWDYARQARRFLDRRGVDTVFCPKVATWLNDPIGAGPAFVCLPQERSPDRKIRAELSEHWAFCDDFGGVLSFVNQTRGTVESMRMGRHAFHYGFAPPSGGLVPVPRERILGVRDAAAGNNLVALVDNNLDTGWFLQRGAPQQHAFDVSFASSVTVSCVRLRSVPGASYPAFWAVEAKDADGDWKTCFASALNTAYFWSGPRVYWSGNQYALECRFDPVVTTNLRIRLPTVANEGPAELQFYGPGPDAPSEPDALPQALRALVEKGVTNLYSGRWVANAVRRRLERRIRTLEEPSIFNQQRTAQAYPAQAERVPVFVTEHTALLARSEDAETTRRRLVKAGFRPNESVIGPWILFDFAGQSLAESKQGYCGLYWAGTGCLEAGPNMYGKRKAADLLNLARTAPTDQDKIELLRAALALQPNCQQALNDLAGMLEVYGEYAEANEAQVKLSDLTQPSQPVEVRYVEGLSLRGVSIQDSAIRPGGTLRIRFFWKAFHTFARRNRAVFLHFQSGGETLFQGDHALLENVADEELAFQPFPEVFVEEADIPIPGDMREGDYRVFMGVYDPSTGRRLQPQTRLENEDDGVYLPAVVQIQAP